MLPSVFSLWYYKIKCEQIIRTSSDNNLIIRGVGMKIDAYSHILPEIYRQALLKRGDMEYVHSPRILTHTEVRMEFLKDFPDVANVLIPMQLPWTSNLSAETAVYLAKLHNDAVAAEMQEYPDTLIAAVAVMPLNDIDNCIAEADRAINQLGMKGIHLPCSFFGEGPDSDRIRPLLERMAEFDLPVWLHPWPAISKRVVAPGSGGWEMLAETADAMFHLACSGIFEKCPDIKIVVHHGGAYIPFFHYRMKSQHFDMMGPDGKVMPPSRAYEDGFTEPDHTASDMYYNNLRKFYADTAFYGIAAPPIKACYDFYGPDRLLFGTDFPLPTERELAPTIDAVNSLDIPDADREKIYESNIKRILKL